MSPKRRTRNCAGPSSTAAPGTKPVEGKLANQSAKASCRIPAMWTRIPRDSLAISCIGVACGFHRRGLQSVERCTVRISASNAAHA
jgi:hypothetical protein